MDWSKIKTIFILTFLALDIYLLYEFFKIRDASKYDFITETSFEEHLAQDKIDYVDLPTNLTKDTYVSAKPKVFRKEEYGKMKGVNYSITDGTVLQGVFDQPISMKDLQKSDLNALVVNKILYGDQYKYFSQNKEEQTITFYQQFKNKTIYNNINGKLTLYVNERNEIYSFSQTLLEEIELLQEEHDVLPPIKAIETLYENGLLEPRTKITKVELGLHTLVQLTASQLLTPTWHFVVDDKENLYVNAFEGQIIEIDDNKEKN
ncbi:two-component system regulatory protein YycI [Bacillus marasmi]|uniref:two-component system regulatory protein YycI n=1 Tax=Bacillus marasmi TaxID=1926279 RepID=UPI0011CA4F88|nr:two-component system regulatory protein YycI [Bacillus marasmi]